MKAEDGRKRAGAAARNFGPSANTLLSSLVPRTPSPSSTMDSSDRIRLAYSPELASRVLRHVGERFAEHLARSQQADGPVLPWNAPAVKMSRGLRSFSERGIATGWGCRGGLRRGLKRSSRRSWTAGSTRITGTTWAIRSRCAAPARRCVRRDLIADKPGGGDLRDGAVVRRRRAGGGPIVSEGVRPAGGGFTGFATHGGSLGNLTALLTRGSIQFRGVWQNGFEAGKARCCWSIATRTTASTGRRGFWGSGRLASFRWGSIRTAGSMCRSFEATLADLRSRHADSGGGGLCRDDDDRDVRSPWRDCGCLSGIVGSGCMSTPRTAEGPFSANGIVTG